jgi:hypothetical protein
VRGRLSYVKIVSPDPAGIVTLLEAVLPNAVQRQVRQHGRPDPAAEPGEQSPELDLAEVFARRGADGTGGYLVTSPASPGYHILCGASPAVWALTLGCSDITAARESVLAAGVPCTPVQRVAGVDTAFFYAVAGGVTFEFLSP